MFAHRFNELARLPTLDKRFCQLFWRNSRAETPINHWSLPCDRLAVRFKNALQRRETGISTMTRTAIAWICLTFAVLAQQSQAQTLTVTTVTRPPFSYVEDGAEAGFSMDLLAALAQALE